MVGWLGLGLNALVVCSPGLVETLLYSRENVLFGSGLGN